MKVKKWLLGLMTFAAMAVVCAVCAGAENEHTAYIMYADYDWFPSIMDYSGYYEDSYGDVTTWNSKTCDVSKSGTYTVSISDIKATIIDEETGEDLLEPVTGEGAVVFRVDIDDLSADFGLGSGSKGYDELKTAKEYMDFAKKNGADVTDVKITQVKDGKTTTVPVDMSKIHFGDLEGNGKFIIDIYNEYSDTKSDPPIDTDKIDFKKSLSVQFTITLPEINQKPEQSEYEYTVLDDGTVEITGYNGNDTDVVVPDKIDGKSVTSIGDWAFSDCTSVTSIKLPNSVTNIGESAFTGCDKLANVTISDGVKSIGPSAFEECTSLTSVTIPNSVTNIDSDAFRGCTSLAKVTIPNSVKSIGSCAFNKCVSLMSITIPDSVTNIDSGAFANNTKLKSITISKNLDEIKYRTFAGCTSLVSVTIPGKIKSIASEAFNGCESLKSVNIPDGVTSIGMFAFENCGALKAVTIPASVTNVGEAAFGYVGGEKIDGFKINYVKNTGGHYYATLNGFSNESCLVTEELDDGTLEIDRYAGNDKSYTIPSKIGDKKVTQIDSYVFFNCQMLKSITIPTTIKAIGEKAFYGCRELKTVTIPADVKTIGDKAFGYYDDAVSYETVKIKGFKISCYAGTAGEKYAKDNGFTYELLDKPTLAKVTGVKLEGRAADALRINWTKNTSADGYIVEMYQGGKWSRVAKITSNSTTTFRKAGLKAGTAYKFRVRAYKMSGKTAVYGAYSATVAARTNPSVMTGAKLGGRAADALRVNWSKNASADGYIVEMYQGNKWVRVAKITSNSTTTFRKAGLSASSVYKFRVRAYKMSGSTALYGNYSATVTARTNPSIVKGVKIGGKAKDALRVNWTKNSSAQGYIVEMYKGGKWVRVAKITNGNTTTFRKARLAKNTAYKFRVRAYHMSGKTALYGNYGSVSGKTAAK